MSIRQGSAGGCFPPIVLEPITKKSISRFVGLSEFRSGLADGSGSRFWFRASKNPPRGVSKEVPFEIPKFGRALDIAAQSATPRLG